MVDHCSVLASSGKRLTLNYMSGILASINRRLGGTLPDQLLTAAELADELRVEIDTIYHWNYRGTGPRRIRVGGGIRYRRSDVDAWLDARTQEPISAA